MLLSCEVSYRKSTYFKGNNPQIQQIILIYIRQESSDYGTAIQHSVLHRYFVLYKQTADLGISLTVTYSSRTANTFAIY